MSFKVGRRECREGGWSARGVLWRTEHLGQAAVEVQMILRERELQAVRMRALPQLPTSTCIWLCTDCRTREAWCLAGTWRTPNDAASGERGAGQHRDHCGEFQYSNIQLPVSAAWCTRYTQTSSRGKLRGGGGGRAGDGGSGHGFRGFRGWSRRKSAAARGVASARRRRSAPGSPQTPKTHIFSLALVAADVGTALSMPCPACP